MQWRALEDILLEEQTITNYVVEGIILGYEFKIRYPFFRGTYLSCIEKLEFVIDGEAINPKTIYFSLDKKQYAIEELKDQYKEYWNILEEATVTVIKKGGIIRGIHNVTVHMHHRVPFSEDDNSFQTLTCIVVKELVAE